MRLTLGNQIKIDSTFNIGLTVKTPTQISELQKPNRLLL